MANDERKGGKPTVAAKPQRGPLPTQVRPPGAGGGAPKPAADGDADDVFSTIAEEVTKLITQPNVLINIPIWGWQYGGKTCALLTAIQYCTPELHGISLARVKNRDDLDDLEGAESSYHGLGLPALAEATAARLAELNQRFFVDLEWPPGTDTAMHYLLEARAASGRLGFVLFPDIMGGSYETLDQAAKNAQANAHAMILMVDPSDYQAQTPQAKEYQDDVLSVIQQCARNGIPTCIMITKDDERGEHESNADKTHATLAALVSKQGGDFRSKILRVSVIGDVEGDWKNAPPPLKSRKPERLIKGFIWTLFQAFSHPRDQVVARVPRTNLKELVARQDRLVATPIPELRLVRDQSTSPGRVVCTVGTNRFILLDGEAGQMTEVSVDPTTEDETVGGVVRLESWSKPPSVVAVATSGALFVGELAKANLWYGLKGQSLAKTQVPYPLHAWTPIGDQTIAGIDAAGTLHTLVFQDGKWVDNDYRSEFIAPSANVTCGLVRGQGLFIGHNGAVVRAILVTDKGKLGELSDVPLVVRYDAPHAAINNIGVAAARKADNTLAMGREKSQSVAAVNPEAMPCFALSSDSYSIAWIAADKRLHAAQVGAEQITSDEQSPLMSEMPNGMVWNSNGTLLMLTFPSGRWAWARRFGF